MTRRSQTQMTPAPVRSRLPGGRGPKAAPLALRPPAYGIAAIDRALEHRFGTSFADVRVHSGDAGHGMARRHGTLAVTVGADIFLGRDVDPARYQEVLAHELCHVVQQRNGARLRRVD